MTNFDYGIRSKWSDRQQTAADIGQTFLQTLDALASIDPQLADWCLADYVRHVGIPIAQARTQITALIEQGAVRDDMGVNPNAGYRAFAASTSNPSAIRSPRDFSFKILAGSRRRNEANFEAGYIDVPPIQAIISFSTFKGALIALISHWPCDWANTYAYALGYDQTSPSAGVAPITYSIFHMPWMSYLPATKAQGLVVPPPITTEKTPDGGLLMIATTNRFDPTNPDHLERSRILSRIMIERTGSAQGGP